MLSKAIQLYKEKKFNEAAAICEEIVSSDTSNVDAYFYLANIFHMRGEIGRAIKTFSRVLTLNPSHTDAAISLSVLYNDIGKYEEAQKIFEVASERVRSNSKTDLIEDQHINKKFASKHFELADLYLTYNRYEEALFEYNKCVGLNPENLEARIKIAKVYAKKGFTAKAYDELRRLKNEQPNYIPVRMALGVFYYGSGKILEAQDEWKKILSKDPSNREAQMYLNLSKSATEIKL